MGVVQAIYTDNISILFYPIKSHCTFYISVIDHLFQRGISRWSHRFA